ncbi:protein-disulfide reductase DsbD [Nitratifractor sp.]
MLKTMTLILGILLATLSLPAGFGTGGFGGGQKFLQPSEAFKVSAKERDGKIDVTIRLGEKIHIYAKDLHFKVVKPENFELQVDRPKPVDYEGDKVYYGTLKIPIPLSEISKKVRGPFTLQVELTGCSDAGICYQPEKYTFDFPAVTGKSTEHRTQNTDPSSENASDKGTSETKPATTDKDADSSPAPVFGGFGGMKQKFLSPKEAFKVSAKLDGETIRARIALGKKIHIYAKELHVKVVKPKEIELDVAKPKPVKYEGDDVYYGTLDLSIPLSEIRKQGIEGPFTLEIDLAGCSDAGICYQPQKYTFDFPPVAGKSAERRAQSSEQKAKSEKPRNVTSNRDTKPQAERGQTTNDKRLTTNEQSFFDKISSLSSEGNSGKIAQALADEGVLFILLLFFVAGLLLALTPCILPMIPILSSIIVKQAGKEGKVSRSTSFLISLVYVVAMAATYALIGIIAGLLGFDLQAHLNNPWVIIPMASLFVALALSLFGYFELGLPASWQSRLSRASDEAQGKGLVGTAIMGSLSALIVGTCTAPVISGAIIFISQTGDAVLGGISLFVMGIGAGMPLLLVGAGADKLVPKPGGWMTRVSQIFGVIMLAMALYVMRGILSPGWFMILNALLLIGSALYMGVFDDSDKRRGAAKLFQLFAFVLLLYGSLLFVGAVAGAQSPLDPLAPFKGGAAPTATAVGASQPGSVLVPMEERKGYTLQRLQQEISAAAKEGRPVIVDIGKENCAACTELKHFTFPDPAVRKAMKRFKFIQIDITDDTPEERAILKHYRLFGAPNILFFDSKGKPLPDKFLVGFVKPEDFVKHLETIR